MVLPIIDEEKRFNSMGRCPRYEGCDSPLCPLDPYLKLKVSVPGRPLCYWYELLNSFASFVDVPPCVVEKIPPYIVHLYKNGLLNPRGATSP